MSRPSIVVRLAATALLASGIIPAVAASAPSRPHAAQFGALPLAFEANDGQSDQQVRFTARGRGYALFLTQRDAVIRAAGRDGRAAVVRMQFDGSNGAARVSAERPLAGKANSFHGNDRRVWRSGISTYAQVRYESVYPGIDVVYYGNARQVEYDFVVAPDADASRIALSFVGGDTPRIDASGALVLSTAAGDLRQSRPVAYQQIGGVRRAVDARYVLASSNGNSARAAATIALGSYDRSQPLIIDPVISWPSSWSTFAGGSDLDEPLAIAVDASGNSYITGLVVSADYPTTTGAVQTTPGGDYDAYVTKINAAGDAIVYSTYLGGNGGNEYGMGIAVDASGNVCVAGATNSTNFPGLDSNSIQSTFGGGWRDAFVTKLNAAGDAIVFSTLFGGTEDDLAVTAAFDASGNVFFGGDTGSAALPGTSSSLLQPAPAGAFVGKISSSGSLLWSSYIAGGVEALTVDGAGDLYVTGGTGATTLPGITSSSAQATNAGGGSDGYVMKIAGDGSSYLWTTFLGGSGDDDANSIAIDGSGNVYVAGNTSSTDFNGASGSAIQATYIGGDYDGFLAKLDPSGSAVLWSTYLGGTDYDLVSRASLGVDRAGNAYVGGATLSTSITGIDSTSMQPASGGGIDSFIIKVNADGASIGWATWLGGAGDDVIYGMTVDANDNVFATGTTSSALSMPGISASSAQPVYAGGDADGFITKISQQ